MKINDIRFADLHDKLTVFKLSGESTRGWDYAIPQPWADELCKMGIENVCQWFVADCSGPSAFPKLHHVGEAIYAILKARSAENSAVTASLFDASYKDDATRADKDLYSVLADYAGNQVFNEADAGFVDMEMLVNIATEAYARGRKSAREEKSEHIMQSTVKPADGINSPLRVVLHESSGGWVTHIENMQNGGYSYGNYTDSKRSAVSDYLDRCLKYGVDPY